MTVHEKQIAVESKSMNQYFNEFLGSNRASNTNNESKTYHELYCYFSPRRICESKKLK